MSVERKSVSFSPDLDEDDTLPTYSGAISAAASVRAARRLAELNGDARTFLRQQNLAKPANSQAPVDYETLSNNELESHLKRHKSLLSSKSLVANLPDKGEKIRLLIQRIESIIDQRQRLAEEIDEMGDALAKINVGSKSAKSTASAAASSVSGSNPFFLRLKPLPSLELQSAALLITEKETAAALGPFSSFSASALESERMEKEIQARIKEQEHDEENDGAQLQRKKGNKQNQTEEQESDQEKENEDDEQEREEEDD